MNKKHIVVTALIVSFITASISFIVFLSAYPLVVKKNIVTVYLYDENENALYCYLGDGSTLSFSEAGKIGERFGVAKSELGGYRWIFNCTIVVVDYEEAFLKSNEKVSQK